MNEKEFTKFFEKVAQEAKDISAKEQEVDVVAEELAKVRKENIDVQQLDKVLNSEDPANVEPVKANTTASFSETPTLEDIKQLQAIKKDLDEGKINKSKIYSRMPAIFQRVVMKECASAGIEPTMANLNLYAGIAIQSFISDFKLEEAYNEFTKYLNEAFEGKDIFESLLEAGKTDIEDKLKELAKKYKEQGLEEQSEKVLAAAKAYEDAHTFSRYVEYLNEHPHDKDRLKSKGKYLKRISRYYDDYDYWLKADGYNVSENTKTSIERFGFTFGINLESAQRFFVVMNLLVNSYPNQETKPFYRYYSLDIIKKLSRINVKQAENAIAKQYIQDIYDTIMQLDEMCDAVLDV